MEVHGPVAAALDVVLAGPHQLHRRAPADRLGDADRLRHHVGVRRRPPSKAAAGEQRVDAHLLRLEAEAGGRAGLRSEEHTSELQSLMRISYAVFCLKKKKTTIRPQPQH